MICIQFNEANFDIIKSYIKDKRLKDLCQYIAGSREIQYSSEENYEELEPWIQWVSFYSGKPLKDHKAFHLGDYSTLDQDDLFLSLEKKGVKVGIFGSMNHPGTPCPGAYIPDPWSKAVSDSSFTSRAAQSVTQYLVNKNSQLISPTKIAFPLAVMFFSIPGIKKYEIIYKACCAFMKKDRAQLSAYFDFFFTMFSISKHKKKKLGFSAIFLNGLAHVQHHYLLSSEKVPGENPKWYVKQNKDPVLVALEIYDDLFCWLHKKIGSFYTTTGLTQIPFQLPEYYWRFKDHKQLFTQILPIEADIQPLMTRDTNLVFKTLSDAEKAKKLLEQCLINGEPAFGFFDLRDNQLFCSFIYKGSSSDVKLNIKGQQIPLTGKLNFVAIKNAGHSGKGWLYMPIEQKIPEINHPLKVWDIRRFIEVNNCT